MALKLAAGCVDGQRVRKLWTARIMVLLAAAGLGVVVVEERQAQEADPASLRTICWSQVEDPRNTAGLQAGSGGCTQTRAARAPTRR
jgi:hypothetical protein